VPVVVPLLISVLALAFSVVTTYESEKRVARDDTHATRVELRGLVQRLIALPRDNLEAMQRYRRDPLVLQQVGSQINTENIVLVREAADLIEEIPSQVTATQYYAVGLEACLAGLTAQCEQLLNAGLRVADNALDATALLREYASLLFSIGEVQRGREKWREAMNIFRRYPERNTYAVASTSAFTENAWATAELTLGYCRQALDHLRSASRYAGQIGSGPVPGEVAATERLATQRCGPSASLASAR
jgi:hypothetical protein